MCAPRRARLTRGGGEATMKRAKINIIGAGNVGTTTAVWCAVDAVGGVDGLDQPRGLTPVPEPGTLLLSGIGALVLITMAVTSSSGCSLWEKSKTAR